MGHHLHLLETAIREEEVHLSPEYSIDSQVDRGFGEHNLYFVTVVGEEESSCHNLIPASYRYTVGVNL